MAVATQIHQAMELSRLSEKICGRINQAVPSWSNPLTAAGLVRVYYRENAIYREFCWNIGCKMLCSALYNAAGISWQTHPLAMREMNQNRANGGLSGRPSRSDYFATAKTDSHRGETRRRKFCHRGWLSLVGLAAVATSNWPPGKIFQINPSTIPAQAGFIRRENRAACRGAGHRHNYLLPSKDVLPKKRIYQGLRPDLAGITLFVFQTRRSKIFARISSC
jgi:hypothetical protein